MLKVQRQVFWLPVLVLFALGLVCLQMGRVQYRGNAAGYAQVAAPAQMAQAQGAQPEGATPMLLVSDAASQPLQAQDSPTVVPFESDLLPPVVSAPVPRGTGLFDEIADRLLRSLLNIF